MATATPPISARDPVIRPAAPADRGDVWRLIEDAGLPTAGVDEFLPRFLVAEDGCGIVGVAGLEVHGPDGVLRSVAVASGHRGRGLGARLTERIIGAAREAGLRRLYLLTTTAERYFPRHGFYRIDRETASPAVRDSVEFREACPASAVAMAMDLP